MKTLILSLGFTILAICATVLRCDAEGAEPLTVHIDYYPEKVVIDGRLDEAVWQEITPITSFIQTEPDEGKDVSERTEARIFYDSNNLYFGIHCYDREAKKIIRRLDVHDASTSSDSIDILIDSLHDRKSGYFFSINSRGVQFDATVLEQNGKQGFEIYDSTWNAVWQDATTIDDRGWYLEVAIPFKILRFSRTKVQEWGMNIGRWITRKNENARWAFVSRFDQVMRPSKAGILLGIENAEPGHSLDFIPYASSRYGDYSRSQLRTISNAGVDARYGLTSNLALDGTLNPDFSQTEADQIDLSLSRFELFYPEKRQFFNEGLDNFRTPLTLFFTRRIGAVLPDGEPQRISFGAKMTGKIGSYKIGFLEALTRERSFTLTDPISDMTPGSQASVAPSANFLVLRVSRDILEKSSIGFITVNRNQNSSSQSFSQHVNGIDTTLLLGDHVSWSAQLSVSSSPEIQGSFSNRIGAVSTFTYNSDLLEYGLSLNTLGTDFDVSQIGFEPTTGRKGGYTYFFYKPFIDRYGIRQLTIGPNWDFLFLQDGGGLDDSGADLVVQAQFKNFWKAEAGYSYDQVRYNRFTPDLKPLPDGSTKVYANPKVFFELKSNNNRAIWFDLALSNRFHFVNFPFYFHGRTRNWSGSFNAKLGQNFRTSLLAFLFQERFENGDKFQDRGSLAWRLSGNFTRKWQGRVLLQYSSAIDPNRFVYVPEKNNYASEFTQKRIAVNSVIAYDFNARSALFVGYNTDSYSPEDPLHRGKEFFVKLSYLFSY